MTVLFKIYKIIDGKFWIRYQDQKRQGAGATCQRSSWTGRLDRGEEGRVGLNFKTRFGPSRAEYYENEMGRAGPRHGPSTEALMGRASPTGFYII